MGLSLRISKRVVVTDSIETGALTTSNLVADVIGTVGMDVVVVNQAVVVVTGCVVLDVLPGPGGKSKLEGVLFLLYVYVKSHHSPLHSSLAQYQRLPTSIRGL